MKINEVCERVGISKDNIRFYEKEGLIRPARDNENNYRDYSEADVVLLERIKLLRALGIPVKHIRCIISGEMTLEAAVSGRLKEIDLQKKELDAVKRICTSLNAGGVTFERLDAESYLDAEPSVKELFTAIAEKDTAEIELTTQEFDASISKMLIGAYAAGIVILLLIGRILGHDGAAMAEAVAMPGSVDFLNKAFLAVYVLMSVVVSVMSVWSSRVKTQVRTFIIAALTLAPSLWALMIISKLDSDKGIMYFAVQIIFVLAMYCLRRRSRKFIEYIRYDLMLGVIFCIILAAVSTVCFGSGWRGSLVTGIVCIIILTASVSWAVNGSPRYRLTMFHASVTASLIIMPGALFTGYHGQQSSWRRGTDEPLWFRG